VLGAVEEVRWAELQGPVEEGFETWLSSLLPLPGLRTALEEMLNLEAEVVVAEDIPAEVVVESILVEVVGRRTAFPSRMFSLVLARHKTMGLRTSLLTILP